MRIVFDVDSVINGLTAIKNLGARELCVTVDTSLPANRYRIRCLVRYKNKAAGVGKLQTAYLKREGYIGGKNAAVLSAVTTSKDDQKVFVTEMYDEKAINNILKYYSSCKKANDYTRTAEVFYEYKETNDKQVVLSYTCTYGNQFSVSKSITFGRKSLPSIFAMLTPRYSIEADTCVSGATIGRSTLNAITDCLESCICSSGSQEHTMVYAKGDDLCVMQAAIAGRCSLTAIGGAELSKTVPFAIGRGVLHYLQNRMYNSCVSIKYSQDKYSELSCVHIDDMTSEDSTTITYSTPQTGVILDCFALPIAQEASKMVSMKNVPVKELYNIYKYGVPKNVRKSNHIIEFEGEYISKLINPCYDGDTPQVKVSKKELKHEYGGLYCLLHSDVLRNLHKFLEIAEIKEVNIYEYTSIWYTTSDVMSAAIYITDKQNKVCAIAMPLRK